MKKTETLEAAQPKEPRVFEATYYYPHADQKYPFKITFSDRIMNQPGFLCIDGFSEIIDVSGPSEPNKGYFNGQILNTYHMRIQFEAWLQEQIRKQTD